jgi:hypothetical protein
MVLPECQVLSFARHHIEAFAERLDIFIGDGLHCGDLLLSLLPNVRPYITFFLFDSTRTKPIEIFSSCQNLVKDINPANAAISAVYSDIGPQYI